MMFLRFQSPARDTALFAGMVALVGLGIWAAARNTDWADIDAALARIGWGQIAVLLGLSMVNYVMRALRWHLYARRLGLPLGVIENGLHFFGGFAMTVTPGRVGELVRMRWIGRACGCPMERAVPLMVMDRFGDLAAMAVLLGAGVLFSAAPVDGAMPVAVVALVGAFVATRPVLLRTLAGAGYRVTGRFARLFVRIRRAGRVLGQLSGGGTLVLGTGLGIAGWLAEGVAFHLLLVWLGADVGAATAIAIFIFATLAGGLTGAPGGVGGAEAALLVLLGLQGVPMAIALPATAIIRLTTLWFAIGIGFVLFPVAEKRSRGIGDDLENT